jgi:hypothetical protein
MPIHEGYRFLLQSYTKGIPRKKFNFYVKLLQYNYNLSNIPYKWLRNISLYSVNSGPWRYQCQNFCYKVDSNNHRFDWQIT